MTTGLIIGKFMPLHLGHQYLVDFARGYADHVIVMMCSIKSEPIPGDIRYKWAQEAFYGAEVIHVTEELPQHPSEHPDFWDLWKAACFKAIRKDIHHYSEKSVDYIFASEDYGFKLAEVLGAKYVPVDHARELVPVSGTKIREDPFKYWEYLPRVVRLYYFKKVCIYGNESTGKSTLCKDLAKKYNTVYVPEYARGYGDRYFDNGKCHYDDMEKIARGHIASEYAMALNANRIMFCDTDIITTTIWSDVLYGKCPELVTQIASEWKYDLYLLMDSDVSWIDNNQRYFPNPEDRKKLATRFETELIKRGIKYFKIDGPFEGRFSKACDIINKEIFKEEQ
jgi:NadR type nicotinamide-nucleotide adenylyltransferase